MEMYEFIVNNIIASKFISYPLIFVGNFLEGDVTVITSSFLAHQGLLYFPAVLFFSFLGITVGDICWFWFGSFLFTKNSKWRKKIDSITAPFDSALMKRPFHIMLLTKFAYGIHHPLLTRMHINGVTFKNFMKLDFATNVIWLTIVASIGYFLGLSYEVLKPYVRFGEVFLLLGIILFVMFEKRLIKNTKKEIQEDVVKE